MGGKEMAQRKWCFSSTDHRWDPQQTEPAFAGTSDLATVRKGRRCLAENVAKEFSKAVAATTTPTFKHPQWSWRASDGRGFVAWLSDEERVRLKADVDPGSPEMMRVEQVFVYGTLMPGQCRDGVWNAYVVDDVTPCHVGGKLVDLGPYPGWLPSKTHRVFGYCMSVGNISEALSRLDDIEGFDPASPQTSLYFRRLIRCDAATNGWAWTYEFRLTDAIRSAIRLGHLSMVLDSRWSPGNDASGTTESD